METNLVMQGTTAVICLDGRFDFNSHRQFRQAVERAVDAEGVTAITVELGGVSYVDSSALGMLLMLRDRVRSANCSVALKGATGAVRQVLEIANFSKLFAIS